MSEHTGPRVLLVDDEEKFLEVLSQRLETRGVHAETSTSGEEALVKIKNRNFDVIVLDMMMPGLGGIETLKRVRKEYPELQIIMLTGRGSVEKAVEAMKEGAVDFLEKPADIKTLMDKISKAKEKKVLLVMQNIEEKVRGLLQRKV